MVRNHWRLETPARVARRCARLFALVVLALAPRPAPALEPDKPFADYVATTWAVEQGLPQVSVLAITQDEAGFIWLGSQGGLSRFDGVHFTRYAQGDAIELGGHIQALLAESGGRRLWVGTSMGLLVREGGHFRSITPPEPARTLPVHALAWAGGRVLVAGPEGIYAVQDDRLVLHHPLRGPALSLLARDEGLWVGSVGQVLLVQEDQVRTLPLPASARTAQVTALAHAEGTVWAGTSHGLFEYRDGRWEAFDAEGGMAVEALHGDRDGNLWVSTGPGLDRIRAGRRVERVRGAPGTQRIRAIFEDRDGNLWLGSMTEGLTRVWDGWTRRLGAEAGLGDLLVWTIAPAPDGTVWVGHSAGVDMWDGKRFRRRVAGHRLPHPEAYTLLVEQDQAWIGTRNGAALYRNGRVQVPTVLAPLQGAQVNGIVRDRARRLWFATTHGLYLLDGGGKLVRYAEQDGLGDARVRLVHETRDGRVLLGTYGGLYEWREGRILPLGRDTGLADDTMVSTLAELDDGRWVLGGRAREDLKVYDGQRWHHLDTSRGVPANIAFHITTAHGHLWVAGMRGVYRIPLAELERALADPAHRVAAEMVINSGSDRPGGQLGRCCNGSGNARGLYRDGMIWLPTRDGVLLLDSTRPPQTGTVPQVRIERVHAGVRGWEPVQQGALELPLGERDLKFEFTVPSFQPTHMVRLHYRLHGYESQWRELDDPALRTATYTNLPPGEYTFEVADFARPNPLASAARLPVRIPPRMHETLAFQILLALLVGGAPYLGYRLLQARHERQRAELERLVQERTRDLQAANARLEAISFTDPLTGLHNRRYLSRQIPADLSFYERDAAYRAGNEVVTFALLDVDHFKPVNDTHGHAAGDRVLEQLAARLTGLVRKGDYVARWGGEEFLLVFRPLPRGSLAQIGQRLCSEIAARPFDLGNGMQHHLTASVGLIEYPLFPGAPRLLGWEQLVTLADRALYRAKACGRNTWVAYRPAPGAQPPPGMIGFEGDPGWLVESGLLEMFGAAGTLPRA